MKRCTGFVAVAALVLSMSSARAADIGNAAGWLGGFSFPGYTEADQTAYGLIHGSAKAGAPGNGQFGLWWDSPVEVTELTFAWQNNPPGGRNALGKVHLYTGPNTDPIVIDLGNAYSETIDLTQFNGGQPIQAVNSYLLLVCPTVVGSIGPMTFSFDATPIGPKDVNCNLDTQGATVTKVTGNYSTNLSFMIDGRVESLGENTPFYFNTQGDRGSVTVEYGKDGEDNVLRTIGSIGLGFAGDVDRSCPKWVLVSSADVDTEPVRIDIDPDQTAYGRYALPKGLFKDVNSLTITMPPPPGTPGQNDAANWWLNSNNLYGITEFQAFAAPIPEPATMALLALGGAAMLRRRK